MSAPSLRPALEAVRDAIREPDAHTIASARLRELLDADQRYRLALAVVMSLEMDDLLWLTDRMAIAAAERRQKRALDEAEARAVQEALEAEACALAAQDARAAIGLDAWRERAAKAATDGEAA